MTGVKMRNIICYMILGAFKVVRQSPYSNAGMPVLRWQIELQCFDGDFWLKCAVHFNIENNSPAPVKTSLFTTTHNAK